MGLRLSGGNAMIFFFLSFPLYVGHHSLEVVRSTHLPNWMGKSIHLYNCY